MEALQKITGQDKTLTVNNKTTFDVNVGGNVGVSASGGNLDTLSPEAAAQVLSAIASDMRKKRDGQ
jgi:hypothetical protein